MKFTLSWLKDHLETDASVEEIVETLTDLGLEVEEVEDRGARLRDFTIGRVLSAEQHPDADRLRVCQVETDEGVKQIICGAPNAREGITVVVAKPGVYVPGIDTTIGVGKIRGIESFGMMASEREMELSDGAFRHHRTALGRGGTELHRLAGRKRSLQGRPGDRDRHHAETGRTRLGVRGIARDLAARGGLGTLKPHAPEPVKG